MPELIEAAMLACKFWKDDAKAIEEMKEQLKDVPPAERRKLVDYFKIQYGGDAS
jgi:hypothetical protein